MRRDQLERSAGGHVNFQGCGTHIRQRVGAEAADLGTPRSGPPEPPSLGGEGRGEKAGAQARVAGECGDRGVKSVHVAESVRDVPREDLGNLSGCGRRSVKQVAGFGELNGQVLAVARTGIDGGDQQGRGLAGAVCLRGEAAARFGERRPQAPLRKRLRIGRLDHGIQAPPGGTVAGWVIDAGRVPVKVGEPAHDVAEHRTGLADDDQGQQSADGEFPQDLVIKIGDLDGSEGADVRQPAGPGLGGPPCLLGGVLVGMAAGQGDPSWWSPSRW